MIGCKKETVAYPEKTNPLLPRYYSSKLNHMAEPALATQPTTNTSDASSAAPAQSAGGAASTPAANIPAAGAPTTGTQSPGLHVVSTSSTGTPPTGTTTATAVSGTGTGTATAVSGTAATAPSTGVATSAQGPSKADAIKQEAAQAIARVKGLIGGFSLSPVIGGLGGITKQLASTFSGIFAIPLLIIHGKWSTRFLTIGLILSVSCLYLSGKQIYQRFLVPLAEMKHTASHVDSAFQGLTSFVREQAELTAASDRLVFMERFSANISSNVGDIKLIEFELYIEMDSPASARMIRDRIDPIREVIASSVQNENYTELMTTNGKDELRRKISRVVNKTLLQWHKTGKVKEVYFSRFIMG